MANTVLPPPTAALLAPDKVGMISDVWYQYFFQNNSASGLFQGGVQGDILFRNAIEWTYLSPGTAGQVLMTEGASANPLWADMVPDFLDQKAFWTDENPLALPEPPRIMDFYGRIFVGQAAGGSNHRYFGPDNVHFGWLGGGVGRYAGATYLARDADLTCVSAVGGIAISGISRTGDSATSVSVFPPSSIGIAGYSVNDTPGGAFGTGGAWAGYLEAERSSASITTGTFSLELDNRNCGDSIHVNPYFMYPLGLTAGIWLNAWAKNNPSYYGNHATNPCTVALAILSGLDLSVAVPSDQTGWNTGIAFEKTAIAGTDGVTGTGTAIDMARGHVIRWMQPDGVNPGAQIYSICDGNVPGNLMQLSFGIRVCGFVNANAKNVLVCQSVPLGANGINVKQAVVGQSPEIQGSGDSADIDVILTPKGAGNVRFGTRTAIADSPVTGYITIKDAGGTTRRLAII